MRTLCLFLTTALLSSAQVNVSIETSLGTIDAVVDTVHAPVTSANFLKYVDAGAYNEGLFHRTVRTDNQPQNAVKIEVIQAGPKEDAPKYPAVPLERTPVTGLTHSDGVLSMARGGPDSATSDFFICIGDQHSLDFAGKRNADGQGFAAFGHVTSGMDIVRRIQASAAEGQNLKPPVRIVRMVRKP
jgi:peptidyl-prolyl cis-trans isomerase A (cyclophilin A)